MLIARALMDGIIFSIIFGGMVTFIEVLNPRLELHNYPPISNFISKVTWLRVQ